MSLHFKNTISYSTKRTSYLFCCVIPNEPVVNNKSTGNVAREIHTVEAYCLPNSTIARTRLSDSELGERKTFPRHWTEGAPRGGTGNLSHCTLVVGRKNTNSKVITVYLEHKVLACQNPLIISPCGHLRRVGMKAKFVSFLHKKEL